MVATITSLDPAIEVQLTVPKLYHLTVVFRLFLIVIWTACIALLSSSVVSALKLIYMPQPASPWSTPLQFLLQQLVWGAPLLWFAALGLCLALLTRSRSASGALLSGIWLMEIIFKDPIFATNWLRPLSLFPTTLVFPPTRVPQMYFDFWLTSRFEVLVMALLLLPLGWLLLHN